MKNTNLLIGAGVVIVGYLLWKKSQKDELNKRVENLTKNDKITIIIITGVTFLLISSIYNRIKQKRSKRSAT